MTRFGSSLVFTDDLEALESILNQNVITKSQLDSGLHTATSIGIKFKSFKQICDLGFLHFYDHIFPGQGRVVDILLKSGADANARQTDTLSSADTTGNSNVQKITVSMPIECVTVIY